MDEALNSDLKPFDLAVASSDPIHATELLKKLPELNHLQDLKALIDLLRSLCASSAQKKSWDSISATAAMRDIGFCLGSVKKLGHEPLELVPELEPVLTYLSHRTQFPPRDTLLHYTVWNPRGENLRTYTHFPDEGHLIESVRMAMPHVEAAIYALDSLLTVSVFDPDFCQLCHLIRLRLDSLAKSIVYTYSRVSPKIFATELRKFYDPISVAGVVYLGPGAVEMPLFVLDHLLWSSKIEHSEYSRFKESYVPYILPELRTLYSNQKGKPSLVDRILSEIQAEKGRNSEAQIVLKKVDELLSALIKFRAPHLGLADRSYKEGSGNEREVGSGGWSADMLKTILQLTKQAKSRLCLPSEASSSLFQEQ